jgi:putative OPT family oligopeptide transporter
MAISDQPLAAPQATLISTLARGVIGGDLPWHLIIWGAVLGLVLVAIDFMLKKSSHGKYSLPPLGVGLAVYLPSAVTAPVVVGAFAGYYFEKKMRGKTYGEAASRIGVLVVSGFIVGESLFNVALAALIVLSGNAEPLAFGAGVEESTGMLIALAIAAAIVVGLYRWAANSARKMAA